MSASAISLPIRLYYGFKPLIPRRLQLALRRERARAKREQACGTWPINESAAARPSGWPGWPEGKQFAVVMTHDVEGATGLARTRRLMQLDRAANLRSAFYFVPARSAPEPELRRELVDHGFEIGVHGYDHSGHLLRSRSSFLRQAKLINAYLSEWRATGFRAPALHHDLDWFRELDIAHDSSTFDTDPFEPQPDGVNTIFPFRVAPNEQRPGYVELPVTVTHDFTLFVLLRERNADVWKRKLDWIAARGGMAMMIAHPDYMRMDGERCSVMEYRRQLYEDFLDYLHTRYAGRFWSALPREVARFCSELNQLGEPRRPRRICMVTCSFYENDPRVIRYARTLVSRGDEVDCIAIRQNARTPRRETVDGVNVLRVQTQPKNWANRYHNLLGIASFMAAAASVLAWRGMRFRYDLIHAHSIPDLVVFAAAPARLRRTRLLLDIHDILPELCITRYGVRPGTRAHRFAMWIERVSARFADHVIVANHIWHPMLTARSVSAEKCTAIPNYIDTEIFPPSAPVSEPGRLRIVHIGNVQRHQGLDLVIRCVAALRDEIPAIELHIYSSGRDQDALTSLVAELGVSDRVRFRGLLPHNDVADVLRHSDLGIVARRNDAFGSQAYCSKILEYMSQGVPVIASNVQVVRHYFDDRALSLFEPENLPELMDRIRHLAHDRESQRRQTQAGYRQVARDNWAARSKEYLDIVDRLAGPRQPLRGMRSDSTGQAYLSATDARSAASPPTLVASPAESPSRIV